MRYSDGLLITQKSEVAHRKGERIYEPEIEKNDEFNRICGFGDNVVGKDIIAIRAKVVRDMKIGFFITRFPYKDRFDDTEFSEKYKYSGGGAEIAAYLVSSLAQKGHEIKVFAIYFHQPQ